MIDRTHLNQKNGQREENKVTDTNPTGADGRVFEKVKYSVKSWNLHLI